MSESTRISLIDRLRCADDNEAWRTFSDVYGRMVMRWLMTQGIGEDDAEDVRQEVFSAVFGEIGQFRHNGRLGAFRHWLRLITINRMYRLCSTKKRHGVRVERLTEIAEGLSDGESELSRQWDREHEQQLLLVMLEKISHQFSPKSIRAFERMAVHGESAAAVAVEMDMSPGALRVAQHRIIRRLRELVAQLTSKV